MWMFAHVRNITVVVAAKSDLAAAESDERWAGGFGLICLLTWTKPTPKAPVVFATLLAPMGILIPGLERKICSEMLEKQTFVPYKR